MPPKELVGRKKEFHSTSTLCFLTFKEHQIIGFKNKSGIKNPTGGRIITVIPASGRRTYIPYLLCTACADQVFKEQIQLQYLISKNSLLVTEITLISLFGEM